MIVFIVFRPIKFGDMEKEKKARLITYSCIVLARIPFFLMPSLVLFLICS